MQFSKIFMKCYKCMISKIKQCFEGHSAGLRRGDLSDREELDSTMRLRAWVQVPALLPGSCKTEQVINTYFLCTLISSSIK